MMKSVEIKFKYFCDIKWVSMSSFAKNIDSLIFLFELVLEKEKYFKYKETFREQIKFNFFKLQEKILKVFKIRHVEKVNIVEGEREKQKVLEEMNRNKINALQRISIMAHSKNLKSSSLKKLSKIIKKTTKTSFNYIFFKFTTYTPFTPFYQITWKSKKNISNWRIESSKSGASKKLQKGVDPQGSPESSTRNKFEASQLIF